MLSAARVLDTVMMAALSAGLACAGDRDVIGERVAALELGPEQEVDPPDRASVANADLIAVTPDAESGGYLAVWTELREFFPSDRNFNPASYAARIGPDGAVLDPSGIRLFPPREIDGALLPGLISDAVCGDGGVCLLVGNSWIPAGIVAVRIADGQLLDATPLEIAPSFDQPTVAWDGTGFRVTWQGLGPDTELYMTRVGVDGQVAPPVAVTDLFRDDGRVACQGSRCLLTHHRYDVTPLAQRARLVDLSGPVGDEFSILPGRAQYGDHCWDGSRYWVSFIHDEFGVGVARVDANGAVIDPEGISLAPAAGGDSDDRTVSVACDDENVLVTWAVPAPSLGSHRAFAARVTLDGTVLDPGGVEIAAAHPVGAGGPVVCGSGECLAVWQRGSDFARSLRATRLDGVTELDPDGIEFIAAPPAQTRAVAAHAGGRYISLWIDSRPSTALPSVQGLRGSIFTPALDQLAAVEIGPPPAVEPDCFGVERLDLQPAVAASASSFLAAWSDPCSIPMIRNLLAQVVDRDGQPLAPAFVVAGRAGVQETHPAAASDGDDFVVLWDSRLQNPPAAVEGRRFDSAGAPLGPERFTITSDGKVPVVAFDGTSYVAVWQRERPVNRTEDLHAARISPDGVVLDATPIPVASDDRREEAQSIACGGGMCLIAWRRGATQNNSDVRALRLTADGSVLDPGGFVVSPVDRPVATSVTFAGNSFLVAWREGDGEVRGAEISLDGAVLAGSGFLISPPGEVVDNPALASNGVDHALALYDRLDLSPAYQIRRVRARNLGQLESWPDAGPVTPDAGGGADGGPGPDAAVDAGVDPGDPDDDGDGDDGADDDDGGCSAGGRSGGAAWAILALLALAWRRRGAG